MRPALMVRAALLVAVAGLFLLGGLDGLQQAIVDKRFSIATRGATGRLLLVDIDEPSIKALGIWPWSRAVHAAILDRLTALGAADVAFDIDFSSPSGGDGDEVFENALKSAGGSVILAALEQEVQTGADGFVMVESLPLPRFTANAWEASVNVRPDRDGKIRLSRFGQRFGSETLPSLPMLLAAQSDISDGSFAIDYGIAYGQIAHLSVRDLLGGSTDPSLVRDRKVIVGASAVELRDVFQVPRFGFMAGSAVQAMAAESILQKRVLAPVPVPLTLLLTAGLLGGLCGWTRRLTAGISLAGCAGAALAVEGCAIAIQGLWPVIPATAPIHVGLLGLAAIVLAEEGIARRVRLLAARRGTGRLRAMLDRVIADNFAGIVIVDQNGCICAASAAATSILGAGSMDVAARSYADVLPGPLAVLVDEALVGLRAARVGTSETCETVIEHQGRPALLLECVVTVSELAQAAQDVIAGQVDHVVCLTFRDITAERQAHDRLLETARVDTLSGLANRAVLLAAVEERSGRGDLMGSALIFFDVDRFKLVNDRLGHVSGDALIRAVADRLRATVAAGDVAARLGGDEFAVVLDRPTRGDVEAFAAGLARALGGLYDIGMFQASITLSIGVAFFEGQSTTEMMGRADAALNAAKTARGGCIRLYDAEMAKAALESDALAHDLRIALHRGEFEVVYQRQVDAATERIIGVEALVRWKHPQRGYVSPSRFIPIAERTGLIEPIGAWVLATACREAAAWSEPIRVSVNLSAVQLARLNLADLILATLVEAGLPANRLDLELTESLLLDDDDALKATLHRLRAAGVKISLDDFGTGYSSLSYLNRFAIDKVKIDQSFVRNLEVPSATAIVRAIIGLARDIGLRVNAEGVETAQQLAVLQQLGCDEIQGYLHGRPDPAAAIQTSLERQNAFGAPRVAAE